MNKDNLNNNDDDPKKENSKSNNTNANNDNPSPNQRDGSTSSGKTSPPPTINRTTFNGKSTRAFTKFFKTLSSNVSKASEFDKCNPTPDQIAAESAELVTLMENSMTAVGDANTGLFRNAVDEAKKTCEKIAVFIETTYPGNDNIAKIAGMRFNKPAAGRGKLPAPNQAPTNVKVQKEGIGCRITWKPIPKTSGMRYNVYVSIDGAKTFVQLGNTSNSVQGLFYKTEESKVYYFYVTGQTSNGEGPGSDMVKYVGQ